MKYPTTLLFAFSGMAVLAGCGGTTETPFLGTAQSPRVRAVNLVPASPSLTVTYDGATNPIGTVSGSQVSAYQTENEGNHTVSFLSGSSTVASYTNVFQFSDYYTTAVYEKGGLFGTFTLSDNNTPIGTGTSEIRVANAVTTASTNLDVYVTPGSGSPTLSNSNLISGTGLAFATGTSYKTEAPGTYTVTVTPLNVPTTIILNQTIILNAGQTTTIYAQDGATSVSTNDNQ
jgi:hypothetical protein